MSGYDVVMQIGGLIKDAESGRQLVNAIQATGFGREWGEKYEGPHDILEDMSTDGALTLLGKDVSSTAARSIQDLCKDVLGLGYSVSVGQTDDEGYDTTMVWQPFFESEVLIRDSYGEGAMPIEVLNDAIEKGIDGVIAARDRLLEARTMEFSFMVEPEVTIILGDLTEEEFELPIDIAPAPTI